jgi:hypothetical protein
MVPIPRGNRVKTTFIRRGMTSGYLYVKNKETFSEKTIGCNNLFLHTFSPNALSFGN